MNTELIECNLKKYVIASTSDFMGSQLLFRFPNDYGASVIIGPGTYGGSEGLYEVGVIKWNDNTWHLCYDTEITDDVVGWLSPKEVQSLLYRIKSLSNDQRKLISQ